MRNKLLILFLFILACMPAFAQDEIYDEEPEQPRVHRSPIRISTDDPYFSDSLPLASFDSAKLAKVVTKNDYNEKLKAEKKDTAQAKPQIRQLDVSKWEASNGLKITLYILATCALLLIIYLIVRDNRLKGRQANAPRDPADIRMVDEVDLDTLDSLLHKAIDQNNLRDAVRLLYLGIIRDLADHRMIVLRREKTNRDYLNELRGKPVHDGFSEATLIFNRIWYGQIEPDPESFAHTTAVFEQVKAAIAQHA